MFLNILPRVKSYVRTSGAWTPKRIITVSTKTGDAFGENAIKALELFLPSHITVSNENAEVRFICLTSAPYSEWYRLTVCENGAILEYADARGAINAAASLAQLILDGEVENCIIEDYPDYPWRGLMLDLARGLREPFQDVKELIIHMALTKYNVVHFNLLDNGLCYASDAVPEFRGSKRCNFRQYTKAQLRELVELCSIFAIDAIPSIEIPAHANAVIGTFPQFACEVPEDHTSKWCICPASDGVFEMYERLISELCEIFPSQYFNIGSDELEFRLQPKLNQLCYWRECKKCQALREAEGLNDIQDEFYYVILRIYEYVKQNGRTMMMWNDQIDISKPCPLPKDILIHYWRVAAKGRGPVEGCSMEGFARQGYRIVNSTFPKTYIDFDFYLKEEELCEWTPVNSPELSEEYHNNVIGSEMCAWEYGNREVYGFYDYTIQPSLPLFCDRLWCSAPIVFDIAYRRAVYKTVFGKRLDADLYEIFGAVIPPRMMEKDAPLTYKPFGEIDSDYIALCIDELAKPGEGGSYQNMRSAYIELLRRINSLKLKHDNESQNSVQNVDA